MSAIAAARAANPSTQGTLRARLIDLFRRFAADPAGSTIIEYGLTLAGLALSVSGVSAAIGLDIAAVFDQVQLEFCKQVYSVCVAR